MTEGGEDDGKEIKDNGRGIKDEGKGRERTALNAYKSGGAAGMTDEDWQMAQGSVPLRAAAMANEFVNVFDG